jgi:hypothetical protein
MKYALLIVQLAFGLGLFLCAVSPAYPHGGGLDAYALTPMEIAEKIDVTSKVIFYFVK